MAEEERKTQNQRSTQQASSTSSEEKKEKTLKVELLGQSWTPLSPDGKTVTGRYRKGAVLELPESLVKSVNGNGFKQSFRVLED